MAGARARGFAIGLAIARAAWRAVAVLSCLRKSGAFRRHPPRWTQPSKALCARPSRCAARAETSRAQPERPRCRTAAPSWSGTPESCRRSRYRALRPAARAPWTRALSGAAGWLPHAADTRPSRCAPVQVWFKTMPNVTKFYLTFSFLTALLCGFDVLNPLQLYLNADLILRNMEVRRCSPHHRQQRPSHVCLTPRALARAPGVAAGEQPDLLRHDRAAGELPVPQLLHVRLPARPGGERVRAQVRPRVPLHLCRRSDGGECVPLPRAAFAARHALLTCVARVRRRTRCLPTRRSIFCRPP